MNGTVTFKLESGFDGFLEQIFNHKSPPEQCTTEDS